MRAPLFSLWRKLRHIRGRSRTGSRAQACEPRICLGRRGQRRTDKRGGLRKNPDLVTLVAMGTRAETPAPEDEAYADYLEHLITGRPYDPVQAFQDAVFQPTTQKFLSGAKEYLSCEDPIFCLQRDLFDVVLTVRKEGDSLEVKAVVR